MSQYIRFIFDWKKAPIPKNVLIIRHGLEWVNRQIYDEFSAVFKDIRISISQDVRSDYDLVVIPFIDDYVLELESVNIIRRSICVNTDAWIMPYGVGYRRIDLMSQADFISFYHKSRLVSLSIRVLDRLRLLPFIYAFRRQRGNQ